ncbi:response regulator [Brevundimonas sp.]|jgi:signal transduction histidine kinase/ActR/RegA family two-component response regulator|uniref:hybrid sensor histidine kinase/response regulator n=1 Tax=Brevundimonas sp. TaxID=1871086 RepID=UPI0037844AF2
MHGRWRLFRHDAGQASGPHALVYVALFVLCLAFGIWSARTFDAVVIWPANGVMLAAALHLHRRRAIQVLAACLVINLIGNLVRGDIAPFWWLNAVMNMGEVLVATVIARRVGGAALDLRRPKRLWRFAFLAVVPAVLLSTVISIGVAAATFRFPVSSLLFMGQRFFIMETLGLLMVTPALLLIAKAHRFRSTAPASPREAAVLIVLLMTVTTGIFFQNVVPAAFLIFPFLLLVAFRTPPSWVAGAVIGVAVIAAAGTLSGHGPGTLSRLSELPELSDRPTLLRHLNIYYIFLLGVLVTALPVSAVMSERRRLILCLKARTETAHAARRRAEQADAAKSRFLALMSHEMRTPLNSVTGYAEVLARRPGMDLDAVSHLGHIQRSGDALLMLVEDVLEISRGDDLLNLIPLSLAQVIDAAAAPSRIEAADKGLTLTVEVRPDALAPVIGDPRRLRQALHHLIGNAVKFTDHGGVTVLADRIDGDILIAVTDTGPGFDPAAAPRLFDPFVQGDDSISRAHIGAGIGLTLVKRQADLMGGDVVIDSRPGEGATFTLRLPLPLAAPEAMANHTDVRPDRDEGAPPRILVVDDHPANREVARLMLAAVGCEVAEACDGDEAIDMVATQPFDLILMDVRMPRVDGLAATRAIRASGSRVPILAVTADAMPEDAARCLAAGMDAHLAKPISHHALYTAMERLLCAPETSEAEAA